MAILKKYDLGFGHFGNGVTVWNRAQERNGDYVTVAHISSRREVTFYEELPKHIKDRIENFAKNSNMTISVSQNIPVFSN
jgi:hypothetical protein